MFKLTSRGRMVLLSLMTVLMGGFIFMCFAGDGEQKKTIFTALNGLVASNVLGTGIILRFIWKMRKTKKAYKKIVEAIIAIKAYIIKHSEKIKHDPDFKKMIDSIDDATESVADVIKPFSPTYAKKLRDLIP